MFRSVALRELHVSRMFVAYDNTILPLSQKQMLEVLKYQLGLRYNKKYLKSKDPPFFVENNISRPIFFYRGNGVKRIDLT